MISDCCAITEGEAMTCSNAHDGNLEIHSSLGKISLYSDTI